MVYYSEYPFVVEAVAGGTRSTQNHAAMNASARTSENPVRYASTSAGSCFLTWVPGYTAVIVVRTGPHTHTTRLSGVAQAHSAGCKPET